MNGGPIVNISVAYNKTNQVPLFSEVYPGSIPDVSQLKYLIEKIAGYNYRSVGVVLHRGYNRIGRTRALRDEGGKRRRHRRVENRFHLVEILISTK